MPRGHTLRWILVALVLVTGLLLLFVPDELAALFGPGDDPNSRVDSAGDALEADSEEAHVAELQGLADARRIPGLDAVPGGTGSLRGQVLQHVAGKTPVPLVGVTVRALGLRGDERVSFEMETDAAGQFERLDAPALFGYMLSVRHAPFPEKLVRGVSVVRDRLTDVGVILLGAPTALRGFVRTSEGGPLRGAVVKVFRDTSRPDSFDLRRAIAELQSTADHLANVRVDANGAFEVDGLPPGRYLLRASAPGYASAFRRGVIVTVSENSTEPRITLDRGSGFEGRVLDESGVGLPGAQLLAVALPGGRARQVDREDARANGAGEYRMDSLTPGVRYFVQAFSEGFAPVGYMVQVGPEVTKRDFTLVSSGRIEGRITDAESGEGLAGAEISIILGNPLRPSPLSTVTDHTGYYAFEHAAVGPMIMFSATAPGYQAEDKLEIAGIQGVRVEAGETLVLDRALLAGGTLRGTVRDPEGSPVAAATVALVHRGRRWAGERTGVTDGKGNYAILGLRAGEYDLRVSASGHAPLTEDEDARIEIKDDLKPATRDIVLQRGATVEGRVLSPEGEPVPACEVRVEAVGGGRKNDRVRDLVTVSGASGEYFLRGVPPDTRVQIVVAHDDYVEGRSEPVQFKAGALVPLDVSLRPGITLPGRVTDARGLAVAGATIRWGNVEGVSDRDLRDTFRADEHLTPRVLRSDERGAFVITHLPPGKTIVKVEHEGFAEWYRRDVQVTAEGEQNSLDVELEGAMPVSGRVRTLMGTAGIAGCLVYARQRDPDEAAEVDAGSVKALVTTETDVQGRYTLPGLPPGKYEIVLWFAPGYECAAREWRNERVRIKDVAAGSKGIEFRVDRIRVETGEPPGDN
jgi:protocatechuate 3,4-dioxygenase beta subunit